MMFSYFNIDLDYFNIVTSLHFTGVFNGLKMLGHIIFFYNTTTLADDIIIRFEGVGHDV